MENRTVKQRLALVDDKEMSLSKRKQCNLFNINRSSLYYRPLGESAKNLELMRHLDEFYLKHPTYGVLRMQDELLELGHTVN